MYKMIFFVAMLCAGSTDYCIRTGPFGGHCIACHHNVSMWSFHTPWRTNTQIHTGTFVYGNVLSAALYCSLPNIVERSDMHTVCKQQLQMLKFECYAFMRDNVVSGSLPPSLANLSSAKHVSIDNGERAMFQAMCQK